MMSQKIVNHTSEMAQQTIDDLNTKITVGEAIQNQSSLDKLEYEALVSDNSGYFEDVARVNDTTADKARQKTKNAFLAMMKEVTGLASLGFEDAVKIYNSSYVGLEGLYSQRDNETTKMYASQFRFQDPSQIIDSVIDSEGSEQFSNIIAGAIGALMGQLNENDLLEQTDLTKFQQISNQILSTKDQDEQIKYTELLTKEVERLQKVSNDRKMIKGWRNLADSLKDSYDKLVTLKKGSKEYQLTLQDMETNLQTAGKELG